MDEYLIHHQRKTEKMFSAKKIKSILPKNFNLSRVVKSTQKLDFLEE